MTAIADEKILLEILELAMKLISIPAISVGERLNIVAIGECYEFIVAYLKNAGLRLIEFKGDGTIPGLYADCSKNENDSLMGKILIAGHYDRVAPEVPEQMNPVIEGSWLKGRGSADMLTVVATMMVFMKELKKQKNSEFVPIGLLLVGNEESGEADYWGTPHILGKLKNDYEYIPEIIIAGERTGEGDTPYSFLEIKNRGLIRISCNAYAEAAHSALVTNLSAIEKILYLKDILNDKFPKPLDNYWKSSFQISYLIAGEVGNFNTLPSIAKAGFEIRPIPEDDMQELIKILKRHADDLGADLLFINNEKGVSTPKDNKWVKKLLNAIAYVNGGNRDDYIGKGKLPGTQARFAPNGCAGVVFGQCGIGPHTKNEAHYIPSILPYYRIINKLIE